MLKRQFESTWNQLRAKKAQLADYLDDVRIQNLRGISDLKLTFPYPVTVLAGPNACGKTTALLACACLYDSEAEADYPGRRYPSDVFPGFRTAQPGVRSDPVAGTILDFSFIAESRRGQMRWSRGAKGKWNKSFFGTKNARQPARHVHIRTLASLTNPSEVRSLLQLGRRSLAAKEVPSTLIAFAHRILPWRYERLELLAALRRDILFAVTEAGTAYSEFHMSSGERAVLRLSQDISAARNSLVLIDEVDVGLHPFTQQQLMLELQRLALRQDLQILVTSHSPIILESVPAEGRIFLERIGANVVQRETFRDILQRALYGRPLQQLSVLCEDRVSKAIVQGVLDGLAPATGLSAGDIVVGHDTGKHEFPQHARTLAKFQQLDNFVFVLDGDGRDLENALKAIATEHGQSIRVLFLPGDNGPEQWIWDMLNARIGGYSRELGTPQSTLEMEMAALRRSFAASTDRPPEVAKQRLHVLMEGMGRDVADVGRIVARTEANATNGTLVDFRDRLHDTIRDWRSQAGGD